MKLRNISSAVLILSMTATVNAATLISYSAIDSPGADPDGTGNVNVWTTTPTTNGSNAGSFIANSGDNAEGSGAGAGTSAWALYAHSGDISLATHTFAGGALEVAQTVGLNFDNGYLDTSTSAGIQLRSGSDVLFSVYFRGGQGFYEYLDSSGSDIDTSQGFTGDGAAFSFTLNSATTYSASFGSANWTGTVSGGIDNIQVFNNNAGNSVNNNVFFNDLTVIPEPSAALLGMIGSILILRRRK